MQPLQQVHLSFFLGVMDARRDRHVLCLCMVMLLFIPPLLTEDQIRLVGPGSSHCSGRVEIYHNKTWGTVCDNNWDMSDAQVVCRQMNCGEAISATQSASFGEGSDPIWLDDVSCSGNESFLAQCGHSGLGNHKCGHSEDAGVVCSEGLPVPRISLSPLVLMWGQSANVTCSITGLSGGTFILRHLNQDVQNSASNPATFNLPQVTADNKGPYHCLYKMVLSGQTFDSPQSDPLLITEPLLPIILPVVAVSLLLLVLIGLYLLHRRRRRRHVVELTNSAPAPMNALNRNEDSDDEEEADYVNAPNGGEDEDSEEPDYANVTANNYNDTVEIYGADDDKIYLNC